MPNPHHKRNKKKTRKASRHRPKSYHVHLSLKSDELDTESTVSETVPENDSESFVETDNKGIVREANKPEEHEEFDCLSLIEKIVNKLQIENNVFTNIMKNILNVTETADDPSKRIKYDLINTILLILSESDMQELSEIRNKVKDISTSKHMYKLYVDNDAIEHMDILGQGSFGVVFQGILTKDGVTQDVAVKVNLSENRRKDFDREIWTMTQFKHENILKILAINRDEPEIVVELMKLGSINDALQEAHFSVPNIVQILFDVASGMEYLHGRGFLHRDLACRNIFIDAKKRCKIGDFGSCVYVGDSNGAYEEKECSIADYSVSPESLISQIFTRQTDVWAMGILVWHVFHMLSATKFYPSFIVMGYMKALQLNEVVLQRPSLCPETIFLYCKNHLLNRVAKDRPNFTSIRRKMMDTLEQKNYL